MQVNEILNEIDREIERLQQARNLLAGSTGAKAGRRGPRAATSAPAAPKKRGGKRRMTAEGRRRISEALKARWAERKKAAKPSKASK